MKYRVLLFGVEQPASLALNWAGSFIGTGRIGPLTAPETARAKFSDPLWVRTLNLAKTSTLWIGEEWNATPEPHTYSLVLSERGSGWRVQPEIKAMQILTGLPANSSIPASRVDAAASLMGSIPWDCCALWIKVSADPQAVLERFRKLLHDQPMDVAVVGIFLTPAHAHWFCRLGAQLVGPLPPTDATGVLATALQVRGIALPPGWKDPR